MRTLAPGALVLLGCTSSPVTPVPADAMVDAFVLTGDTGGGPAGDVYSPFADVSFADAPFVCGAAMCSPGSQYCLHVAPEGGLTPDSAQDLSDRCVAVPASCAGMPTCACLEPVAPCEAGVEGEGCIEAAGVEITCPSP
jgi:hypothetical protein